MPSEHFGSDVWRYVPLASSKITRDPSETQTLTPVRDRMRPVGKCLRALLWLLPASPFGFVTGCQNIC